MPGLPQFRLSVWWLTFWSWKRESRKLEGHMGGETVPSCFKYLPEIGSGAQICVPPCIKTSAFFLVDDNILFKVTTEESRVPTSGHSSENPTVLTGLQMPGSKTFICVLFHLQSDPLEVSGCAWLSGPHTCLHVLQVWDCVVFGKLLSPWHLRVERNLVRSPSPAPVVWAPFPGSEVRAGRFLFQQGLTHYWVTINMLSSLLIQIPC